MSDREELQKLRRLKELEAKSMGEGVPQPKPRSDINVEGPINLAKGIKGGFDRFAYGVSDLMPDLPISKENRNSYNQNPVVRTLGLTMPGKEERQAEIDRSRQIADGSTSGMIGDAIGNSIPNLAVGIATGGTSLLPAAGAQALTSFIGTPGDMGDRAKAGALSAAGEGAGRLLVNALSRLVRPVAPTPAAQRLIDQGVVPMPGQAAGGGYKRFEEALSSRPGFGAAVTRGQRDAAEQGAQLAMSQSGVQVPAGREGYRQLSQHFDDAFTNATHPLAFDLADPAFSTGVQNIVRQRALDTAGADDVARFLDNARNRSGNTNGFINGDDFHAMLQNLRGEGAAFRKSQDPFHRRLGDAYRDIYNLADNSLATQGHVAPDAIDAFREVRRQYAQVAPALKAGELNTVVRNQGVFTPEQYQNSLANNAKRMGNTRALREGTLPQQQLADDMVEVLGGRYPDSGTALRTTVSSGIPFLSAASDALGYGVGRGLYSEPVRRYMVGGYNGQRAIAEALRNFAPVTGTLGAAVAPQIDW